jgi:hypothetical protein
MKLYYDMLVPYMPDSIIDDKGEPVEDAIKLSGRQAMMELSKFQNLYDQHVLNISPLYQSVIYACNYAKVDLVDTILNCADIEFPDGATVTSIIDEAAIMLFKSIRAGINPEDEFNVNAFAARILSAAHAILVNIPEQDADKKESDTEDVDKS